jgi:hypothetical protein
MILYDKNYKPLSIMALVKTVGYKFKNNKSCTPYLFALALNKAGHDHLEIIQKLIEFYPINMIEYS